MLALERNVSSNLIGDFIKCRENWLHRTSYVKLGQERVRVKNFCLRNRTYPGLGFYYELDFNLILYVVSKRRSFSLLVPF